MKNKEITYNYFQSLTKNKDKAVNYFITNTLNKTQSMFFYKNLPVTIPQNELESLLQRNGFAFFTKVENDFFVFDGGLGGQLDMYYRPTKITVANPFLNLSKEYDIFNDKDGVLIKNDFYLNGLLPIVGKYAVLLTDTGISLNTAAVLTRLTMLISAKDNNTVESAEKFLEKILAGDFGVIAENAFLDGLKLQQSNVNNVKINELIELNQYYKSNLLAEIGLNSNFNMKRERLNETEILLNNDDLLPFVENMLFERQNAVKRINEKYGLNIEVELKSVWKTEKENNEKTAAAVETKTDEEIILNSETENPEPETDENETEKIVNLINEMRKNETENETEKNETDEPETETDETKPETDEPETDKPENETK